METKFNFKEIQEREDRLAPGHRMCAGCGGTIAVRNVLKALYLPDEGLLKHCRKKCFKSPSSGR